MATYHFSAQIISRGKGRSAIAAAAYRAATRLTDTTTGKIHDYTSKRGLLHSEILLPTGAARWLGDREKLWNHEHQREHRHDSQLAREINLALPHELDADQRLELVRSFVLEEFVAKGMVADLAIHAPVADRGQDLRNHHAHLMLSLRKAGAEGLTYTKTREWNSVAQLKHWRADWEARTNRALAHVNARDRIDHRSLTDQHQAALAVNDIAKARTLDRLPEIHVGPAPFAMHEQDRRPRALLSPVPPPSPLFLPPPTDAPAPIAPTPARQVHIEKTAALAAKISHVRPDPIDQSGARSPKAASPDIADRRHYPKLKPKPQPKPKPFLVDTRRFEIVKKERHREQVRYRPMLKLLLRESRPRRAWKSKVSPQERLTRLEFNLTRIEKYRVKATSWVRHAQARQARMMARWRKWRSVLMWLISHSNDAGQISRLFKRLMGDQRMRQPLAAAVSKAKAEETRLHRRCYEVRLKLNRQYGARIGPQIAHALLKRLQITECGRLIE
ncbi:MAG: MobQ family relaxase [Hyphomicrobium sp.]